MCQIYIDLDITTIHPNSQCVNTYEYMNADVNSWVSHLIHIKLALTSRQLPVAGCKLSNKVMAIEREGGHTLSSVQTILKDNVAQCPCTYGQRFSIPHSGSI